jgi:uncharacterized protein YbjT (DUF2867 family)
METQVTVIGVTGNVGSRVAAKLAQKGMQVRGIARNPSQLPRHTNVELVAADLTDRQQAEKALQGSQAVYLTTPEGRRSARERKQGEFERDRGSQTFRRSTYYASHSTPL